ncbi:hypothetical protein BO94DRAFT_253767 [Aspergillus sclerotioniger CBS 115572]|uniref:Uncharacterized protein n=1 Tax=Aspergillus sclerotioniger CBS 115572 TaxID=1450535 RepID=A0A317VE42_9EURO|nr:hypothetical protein BO94DRAFT_253767 [Aspergillus sclerotioniger CBS 115572]PWY72225.1 hypothetical protein BO94DRAFT_253767 [Aspergillus sclerotioniger CBS 115572]
MLTTFNYTTATSHTDNDDNKSIHSMISSGEPPLEPLIIQQGFAHEHNDLLFPSPLYWTLLLTIISSGMIGRQFKGGRLWSLGRGRLYCCCSALSSLLRLLCLTCVRAFFPARRSFWMACWGIGIGRGRDEFTGLAEFYFTLLYILLWRE